MHRRWTTVAALIAMLCVADTGEARTRTPSRTGDAPPLPYRLEGMSGPSAPGSASRQQAASPEPAPSTSDTTPPSPTGVIRDGFYYPPPVTVTTVIEYRRR